jgi:hypothetical protein
MPIFIQTDDDASMLEALKMVHAPEQAPLAQPDQATTFHKEVKTAVAPLAAPENPSKLNARFDATVAVANCITGIWVADSVSLLNEAEEEKADFEDLYIRKIADEGRENAEAFLVLANQHKGD